MSHIEEAKTDLVFSDLPLLIRRGDPQALAQHHCIALLRQAATLVAQQYGGEIKPYYYTFRFQERAANTGICLHIPETAQRSLPLALPRGIGLVIDEQKGTLTFRGDPWDVDEQFYQQVQQQIVQKYTVLAHMAALRQMQYQVSTQEVEGRIQITGVSYA